MLNDFGRNVRFFRVVGNQTQDDLATTIEKPKSYIYRIEKGECEPPYQLTLILAEALNVEPDILFEDHEMLMNEIVKYVENVHAS